MAMGKWLEAAKEFQKLISSYPDSKLYEQAIRKQFEIGISYMRRVNKKGASSCPFLEGSRMKHAIEVYGMVVSNQPFMPGSAEAQYKIGLCHHARKEYIEAAYEYRRVIENYPQSDWVDDAVMV
jgi:TolA-binding protein